MVQVIQDIFLLARIRICSSGTLTFFNSLPRWCAYAFFQNPAASNVPIFVIFIFFLFSEMTVKEEWHMPLEPELLFWILGMMPITVY